VQVLGFPGPGGDFGGIGQRLRQRRIDHRRPRLAGRGRFGQGAGGGPDGRHAGHAPGEAKAHLRLGAHVPPQAEAPGPGRRQCHQSDARTADQLELDLVHGTPLVACQDLTPVVRDLDQRAAAPHLAVQALDVGAIDGLQGGAAGQRGAQCCAGRRTRMPLCVQFRNASLRRQTHLVLQARH
jgi:hypothetical protein